jgi:hypothetical protein
MVEGVIQNSEFVHLLTENFGCPNGRRDGCDVGIVEVWKHTNMESGR